MLKNNDCGWANSAWSTGSWGTAGFGWSVKSSAASAGSSVTSSFNNFSMDFDGTHYVTGAMNTLNSAARASWSFWFKRESTAANWSILAKSQNNATTDQFNFRNQGSSPYFNFIFANGASFPQLQITTNPSIAANVWYHGLVAYNGGEIPENRVRFYLNGTFRSGTIVGTVATTLRSVLLNFAIGAGSGGAQIDGPANIDEVAIWNAKALSATQVSEIYNLGGQANLGSLTFAGPTHYWRFGDNVGDSSTMLMDTTGSANLDISFKSGSGNVYVADVP